ncbi:hypothetical protein IFT84_08515 [Rhizobium sp. CFBP 8762]|uniref:hypothetical protein n=1 Tax=Rhizobium sp. CFBP 8762 TaxID=2775279 RepID=UPI00177E0AF6|nr:hypothetical protein [Rhizobium sp. CFBP 8762]MBD8554574.1 hypothetical protein [Rhizobium sp. CFBP 8762]
MPKDLVEGSRVYFLNAGSYTTAYVMELFNRTKALSAFCFPDPLTNNPDPRPWMKGVVTQGEAAHPGKDFKALRTAYRALNTDVGRRRFLTENLPGAGTLGMGLLPASQIKRVRELNDAILKHNTSLPGDGLQIGFQPQMLFKTIEEGWVANSSIMSLDDWQKFSNIQAKGGAKAYFCIQNQHQSSGKLCTLMHATLVVVPENKADGPTKFLEMNYNPYVCDGLDEAWSSVHLASTCATRTVTAIPLASSSSSWSVPRLRRHLRRLILPGVDRLTSASPCPSTGLMRPQKPARSARSSSKAPWSLISTPSNIRLCCSTSRSWMPPTPRPCRIQPCPCRCQLLPADHHPRAHHGSYWT